VVIPTVDMVVWKTMIFNHALTPTRVPNAGPLYHIDEKRSPLVLLRPQRAPSPQWCKSRVALGETWRLTRGE
jgi:hypothetical protein